jgi:hypothetical protein
MAINFRLCPNDTTKWLREMFGAIPLRVPESRIQPLLIIAKKGDKIDLRGELRYLLKDNTRLNSPLREDTVANALLQRTAGVNTEFGLRILDGFLQGLKMSSSPVGAVLKGSNEISFSFTNVKRRWIDLNHLGATIKNRMLDLEHPSLGIFKGEDAVDMLLITDVIISNSFTINQEKGRDDAFDVGLPLIQEYISDLGLKVKVKSDTRKSITFEGEEYLSFAFSCVRLEFDAETGAIKIREVLSRGAESIAVAPERTLIDENAHRIGMLTWD